MYILANLNALSIAINGYIQSQLDTHSVYETNTVNTAGRTRLMLAAEPDLDKQSSCTWVLVGYPDASRNKQNRCAVCKRNSWALFWVLCPFPSMISLTWSSIDFSSYSDASTSHTHSESENITLHSNPILPTDRVYWASTCYGSM